LTINNLLPFSILESNNNCFLNEKNELKNIQQIATARIMITARQKVVDFLKAGPENMITIAKTYFDYIRDLLKQLGEVIHHSF
jgi:hypothetical protein